MALRADPNETNLAALRAGARCNPTTQIEIKFLLIFEMPQWKVTMDCF